MPLLFEGNSQITGEFVVKSKIVTLFGLWVSFILQYDKLLLHIAVHFDFKFKRHLTLPFSKLTM